ncbi:MAG: hypothetical protein EBV20_07050 [Betaproteobacteria bacterium]|nr:hypothetical protein [Betaproteobacteria bacterium]NBP45509.1 hypothetical protein [Betaproteobacteria bacterium]
MSQSFAPFAEPGVASTPPGMSRRVVALGLGLLIVGCATPQRPHIAEPVWRGRLSIQHPEPEPRSETVQFELGGNATQGWLSIQSPFGQSLAELSWSPQTMILSQGGRVQSLHNLESWGQRWLGVPVSPHMLFNLLQDSQATLPSWEIERRGVQQLRLTHRQSPKVQIRIWVDERPGQTPS